MLVAVRGLTERIPKLAQISLQSTFEELPKTLTNYSLAGRGVNQHKGYKTAYTFSQPSLRASVCLHGGCTAWESTFHRLVLFEQVAVVEKN